MKILIVEDDTKTRDGLKMIFEDEGYDVVTAPDGSAGMDTFHKEKPDVVCLDVMMPKKSGFDVCREIRSEDGQVPVLFISAKSEEIDKVLGLELGADDFIVKPFGVKEVVARIRAVTRRAFAEGKSAAKAGDSFEIGDLRVVPDQLRAFRGDQAIDLSLRDIKILRLLQERQGRAIDRDVFFDTCWGFNYLPNSRTLDQHVSQLRKRIERDPKNPEIIKTVHGVGYRYD